MSSVRYGGGGGGGGGGRVGRGDAGFWGCGGVGWGAGEVDRMRMTRTRLRRAWVKIGRLGKWVGKMSCDEALARHGEG